MKSMLGFLITTTFLINVVQAQTGHKPTCTETIDAMTNLVETKWRFGLDPAFANQPFDFQKSGVTAQQLGAGPKPTMLDATTRLIAIHKSIVISTCKLEGAQEAISSLTEQLPQLGDNSGDVKEPQMN